jgi:HD-GYP domain-containing protein (c-di-GMP phosphodiesterase class II)
VVDAYSSMIDDRTYRKALTHEEALKQLRKNSGTQFDPGIVDVFLKIMDAEKPDKP